MNRYRTQSLHCLCSFCLLIFYTCSYNCSAQGNLVQGGNWQISGSGGAWYGYSGGADGGPFMGPDTQNRSQFYQNLLTTPGQSYLLSFYIRGSYPAGQSPPFAMNVYWNSQQVGSYTLNVFSSDWVFESLPVVGGSSSQSVLGFSDPDPTFSAFSDVSVIAIPEPSLFALLGLGAAIALAWVRVESNVAAA